MNNNKKSASFCLALSSLVLTLNACGGNEASVSKRSFTLQLLHASDFEAGGPAVEDAPRFSAILNSLRAQYPHNTLVLASGDNYIPGPFFSAAEDSRLAPWLGIAAAGRADIQMLNAIGIQASTLGNHEFDLGPATLKSVIAPEQQNGQRYPGASFPYLSANLDFSADSDLAALVTADGQAPQAGRIARSSVIEVAGERIGIVGATTPSLGRISSPGAQITIRPSDGRNLQALAAEIQPTVDALTATGINKIILLAHMQQLDIERQLAGLLRNVDIIVAGGSHTLLADSTDRLRSGDRAAGEYPLLLTSASGEPVALVNTAANYRYVGRLVCAFDQQGRLVRDSINSQHSGAYATDEQGVAALGGPSADSRVTAIAQAIKQVLLERDRLVFGATSVYLEGRREQVRTEETNLGNLSADANLWLGQQVDARVAISLKNGGGIRDQIGEIYTPGGSTEASAVQYLPPAANSDANKREGQISQFNIQNALRFNNHLSLVTVSAEQLRQLLEHGVAESVAGKTPGRFPQVAGLRFSYDLTQPVGQRVRSLLVLDSNGAQPEVVRDVIVQNGQLQGDAQRPLRVITLTFMADGGDHYPFPNTERVDLSHLTLDAGVANFSAPSTEQDALAEYLSAHYPPSSPYSLADTPANQDLRIQNLGLRADTVLSD